MFETGRSGNPAGRPKGSYGGRMQVLASLDTLLAKHKSKKGLIKALAKELETNPIGFFKTIVMPLLPRESKLSVDGESVLEWKSLVEVGKEHRPAALVEARRLQVEGPTPDFSSGAEVARLKVEALSAEATDAGNRT